MRFGFRELLFFGVIIGLMVGSYFVLKKKQAEREQIEIDTTQKQSALNELHQATAGIDDLKTKITELQHAITFFESKLPKEKEIDTVLKEVSQMADANSLQTRTFKTLKIERFSGYSEQPIQMTLSGEFNGFYSFLQQLEKLPRITRVSALNLQKNLEKDGELNAQMTLSIFFEPESDSKFANGD